MYVVTQKGDVISVEPYIGIGYIEKKVYCKWSALPSDREYTVFLSWANSEGEAINIGKALINSYIIEYSDPMVTILEVVEGKKAGASYEEILHVICEALIKLGRGDELNT